MENLNFENRVQNKCFWKAFHLILMHFIHKIQCFEEFLHKIALFLKNLNHDIRLIEKQFQSIDPNRGSLKFLKEISIDRKTD